MVARRDDGQHRFAGGDRRACELDIGLRVARHHLGGAVEAQQLVGKCLEELLLPPSIGQTAGIAPLLFGLIIVLVIVFEPGGIYGRWMKIRFFFETFPYYRKSSFVRQKSYLKTERMR